MSTMAFHFAPMTLGDVPQLAELMQHAFPQAFGEAWSAEQLAGIMDLPQVGGERVEYAGRLAGFSLFRHVAQEAELLLVAVMPHWRQQGLGQMLVERVAHLALHRGAETLFLEVRDGNLAAQSLYTRLGFTAVGRRKAYYRGADGFPHDAVTMRLDLSK